MPTLYQVKAGENFLKGVPKDNFRKLFLIRLKIKSGPEEIFFFSSFDLNKRLETWSQRWGLQRKAGDLASLAWSLKLL
jgi:hypothetical protein